MTKQESACAQTSLCKAQKLVTAATLGTPLDTLAQPHSHELSMGSIDSLFADAK